MAGMKELKTRIKSIQSTRKITRAMQLVSAAKMRKAQNATIASRGYSKMAWDLISNLAGEQDKNSSLLAAPAKATKVGIILISTNTGFVGSLNSNLATQIKDLEKQPELLMEFISYGKKGKELAVRMGKNLIADFSKQDRTVKIEDIFPLAELVMESFQSGQYKKIVLIYNHFISTISQKPTVKQLLPFIPQSGEKAKQKQEYLFEPSPKSVMRHLLPRIVESQIYQAILESNASEHSARMVMMKNATEAAGDLINDLTLTYNQMRQGKITTELSEITAGKIALE